MNKKTKQSIMVNKRKVKDLLQQIHSKSGVLLEQIDNSEEINSSDINSFSNWIRTLIEFQAKVDVLIWVNVKDKKSC